MARVKPPTVPEVPVPVLHDDQLSAILRTVERGRDFISRRDHAILRLLMDSGMRRAECRRRAHFTRLALASSRARSRKLTRRKAAPPATDAHAVRPAHGGQNGGGDA